MFSYIIGVEEIEATGIFDYLYTEYFIEDFVNNQTYLNKTIFIDPQSHYKEDGKEKTFWHLTTRTVTYTKKEGKRFVKCKERVLDIARADRFEWVKKIIENHSREDIKIFYKKETKDGQPIRLYLWLYKEDFVVILQKLGNSSSFLVTSFYIDHADKKNDYEEYYKNYLSGTDTELFGCEWF